ISFEVFKKWRCHGLGDSHFKSHPSAQRGSTSGDCSGNNSRRIQSTRRNTMKFKAWPVLMGAALLTWAFAGGPPQPAVVQIDHEKVAAGFAKGEVLLATNHFKIQAGRRDAPGLAEIHEHDTDIFHVLEGTATLVTGGTATEPNTISPGEIRGKAVTGGE